MSFKNYQHYTLDAQHHWVHAWGSWHADEERPSLPQVFVVVSLTGDGHRQKHQPDSATI